MKVKLSIYDTRHRRDMIVRVFSYHADPQNAERTILEWKATHSFDDTLRRKTSRSLPFSEDEYLRLIKAYESVGETPDFSDRAQTGNQIWLNTLAA